MNDGKPTASALTPAERDTLGALIAALPASDRAFVLERAGACDHDRVATAIMLDAAGRPARVDVQCAYCSWTRSWQLSDTVRADVRGDLAEA